MADSGADHDNGGFQGERDHGGQMAELENECDNEEAYKEHRNVVETKYLDEEEQSIASPSTTFNYGHCLIKSKDSDDIRRGIAILESLIDRATPYTGDCLLYIAEGYLNIGEIRRSRLVHAQRHSASKFIDSPCLVLFCVSSRICIPL